MVIFDSGITIRNQSGINRISLDADKSLIILKDKTGKDTVVIQADPAGLQLLRNKDGKDTVVIHAESGIILRDQKGRDTIFLDAYNSNLLLKDKTGKDTVVIQGNGPAGLQLLRNKDGKDTVVIHAESGITLRNQKGQDTIFLDAYNGDIVFRNADCAEDFEVSASEPVEAGTVMTLNDIGQLEQGKQPYDKRVAGVVSGAGDLKPGLVLGRQPGRTDLVPLALMGRVNCKVDANYDSIEVGDLLTTSATPGRAMKASDPARSFGAVIGKALRPLKAGTGMVPILVALQ
jgi:hypothetical protein